MTLTPFEQVHKNMATLGIRIAESMAVDNMITQLEPTSWTQRSWAVGRRPSARRSPFT